MCDTNHADVLKLKQILNDIETEKGVTKAQFDLFEFSQNKTPGDFISIYELALSEEVLI